MNFTRGSSRQRPGHEDISTTWLYDCRNDNIDFGRLSVWELELKTLKVTFVESGQIAKSKRSSSQETGIRYDMSQFYSMKDVMEQLFGKRAYLRLKETASLKDWKESTIKLLNAILLATESSIAVADDDWRNEITDAVKRGVTLISSADHISDLFSCLAATLTRIVFVQIGCMPNHRSEQKTVRLTKEWWTLSHFRSVRS